MNENILEGQWKQLKGKVKQQWGLRIVFDLRKCRINLALGTHTANKILEQKYSE